MIVELGSLVSRECQIDLNYCTVTGSIQSTVQGPYLKWVHANVLSFQKGVTSFQINFRYKGLC